jgi:hypothetical protein
MGLATSFFGKLIGLRRPSVDLGVGRNPLKIHFDYIVQSKVGSCLGHMKKILEATGHVTTEWGEMEISDCSSEVGICTATRIMLQDSNSRAHVKLSQ